MDFKEIGICGFVVVGGTVFGVSEYGLGDVLQDELKAVAEVPMDEREAYMQSVSVQFTEFYEGALFGTDSHTYAGEMTYELQPSLTEFIEVTQSFNEIPKNEIKELKIYHSDKWSCETEDVTLFTDKGWTYTTKYKNLDGRTMVTVRCNPKNNLGLRVG